MNDTALFKELEKSKAPRGEVTLIGLGRLGFRTALNLMQVHRGGPERITAIDGQTISPDDLIFRIMGAWEGEFKTSFLQRLAGPGYGKKIVGIPTYISEKNLDLVGGEVVCIEIAGGDTLPVTAAIIRHAQEKGAATVSTMGVFGIGDIPVRVADIDDADPHNPIVETLRSYGVRDHLLVGTGKLLRDWEPIIPPVLDRVAQVMTSEIIRLLERRT